MLRTISNLYLLVALVIALLLICLPWLPNHGVFGLLAYVLSFSPRWLLLLAVLPLFLCWTIFNSWQRLLLISSLMCTLMFQDLQWRGYLSSVSRVDASIARVLSINMGAGGDLKQLAKIVSDYQADIVVMQEMQGQRLELAFGDEQWYTDCKSHLCIASLFPIKALESETRRSWGGWGSFVQTYQIETNLGQVALANVHFETPRPVLEGLRYGVLDWQALQMVTYQQDFQAGRLRTWAEEQQTPVMIVGDLNLTVNQAAYRHFFSDFSNALSDAGIGLNYTKYTRWHGIRIDHQLVKGLTVIESTVVDTVDGDHLPIVSDYIAGIN